MKLGKRKRAPLVKCGGGNLGLPTSSPSYEKSFCLCIAGTCDSDNPGKWYTLNLSSKEDNDKEEKEKNAAWLLHIPSAELRGSHLAFHHNKRHRGEKPPVLPLITELKFKYKYGYGPRLRTRCAIMGSKIFRIGGTYGSRLSKPGFRKVTYFDASHPKEGWKSGPRTNCGRAAAAVVALGGKLYVFGGCHPDIPGGFFAEFLDTTTSTEEKGDVNSGWQPLQAEPPQSLGFEELFAAALDVGGEYSGKILVGSKLTGVVCLYDVEQKLWKTLDLKVEYGEFISNPIVVGTTIYWFKLGSKKLCAYDFDQRQMFSIHVGDFKICQNLGWFKDRSIMCPTLLHLAGDLFCMLWVGDKLLHCTKLRVLTTEVMDASVLCCHSYRFDQAFSLADCLPLLLDDR